MPHDVQRAVASERFPAQLEVEGRSQALLPSSTFLAAAQRALAGRLHAPSVTFYFRAGRFSGCRPDWVTRRVAPRAPIQPILASKCRPLELTILRAWEGPGRAVFHRPAPMSFYGHAGPVSPQSAQLAHPLLVLVVLQMPLPVACAVSVAEHTLASVGK